MRKVVVTIIVVVSILIVLPLATHLTKSQGDQEVETGKADSVSLSNPLRAALSKAVVVDIDRSPDGGGRPTVQYAVREVCEAAGISYQWNKSQDLAGDYCRRFIQPVHLDNVTAEEALTHILSPVDGSYDVDADGLYLK